MRTVSGNVTDAKTGEKLPYASIYLSDETGKFVAGTPGTITDQAGNYTLTGEASHITASYTGYERQTKPYSNWVLFQLTQSANQLPEITVTAKRIVKYWPYIIILAVAIFVGIKMSKL